MLRSQGEDERLLLGGRRFDRELGDESVLMLDLRLQIIIAEDGCRTINDIGQLSRGEAVIDIIRHPGLEAERRGPAGRPSAVQEGFVDAAHLRDMGMGGDQASIGKKEPEMVAGVIAQGFQELRGFHAEKKRRC